MDPPDPRPPGAEPPPAAIPAPLAAAFPAPAPSLADDQFASASAHAPRRRSDGDVKALKKLPMFPLRLIAVLGVATAFLLSGWQISRVINDDPRLAILVWGSVAAGAIGAAGVVLWTYVVVENARRVFSPATTQTPPDPGHAAATWIVPLLFVAGSSFTVAYLSQQLNSPIEGTESSLPLLLAIVAMLIALPVMYPPASYLSGVVRKIGGHGVKLAEWLWVPVTLAAVGAAMIFGLRAGGAFGEDVDGVAPTWVVAVAAIIPAVVVVLLGWRAAEAVETDVVRAFDRRLGTTSSVIRKRGMFSGLYAEQGPNYSALTERGRIRQLPGCGAVGTVITAGLAGLALLSVVGAIVMYLFWDEGRDGLLLPSQSNRAWDVLSTLQNAERIVAFGLLGVAALWTALAVTNVRLASARHRNPLIAVLAWPVAAAGIWIVGDRLVAEGDVVDVIVGFGAQAVLLYLPFAVLERAADAVGARRNPLRTSCVIGIALLVYVQGLGGLSTLPHSGDPGDYGRLAGYLAIGALVQLLAMFAVTDATRSLTHEARHIADQHNALVDQRGTSAARPDSSSDAVRDVAVNA